MTTKWRVRITTIAVVAFAIAPVLGLKRILRGLLSGDIVWSGRAAVDCFNLLLALASLYLAVLEARRPVVGLRGFWKPSRTWLIAAVFSVPFGLHSVLNRGETAGWVIASFGVVTLVRCVRDLYPNY